MMKKCLKEVVKKPKVFIFVSIISVFFLLNISGISAESMVTFSEIEHYFEFEGGKYYLKSDLTVNSNIEVNQCIVLNGYNIVVKGNLSLEDGSIDLNSGTLKVEGILNVSSRDEVCIVDINGGSLIVEGNFELYGDVILKMTNKDDYVLIEGDFLFRISRVKQQLDAGVFELKGNLKGSSHFVLWDYWIIEASGTHKFLLSGDEKQTISVFPIKFNILEFKNTSEEGIHIGVFFGSNELKSNGCFTSELNIERTKLVLNEDLTIRNSVNFKKSLIDLNGNMLKVEGGLKVEGYHYDNSIVDINGGSLIVEGNFKLYENSILKMTNEEDYVLIEGDFLLETIFDNDQLSGGIFELQGDFFQKSTLSSFKGSETHKVILSGNDVQYVKFSNPEIVNFNILELTKELETGYVFLSDPFWNQLKEGDLNGDKKINSADLVLLRRYILEIIDDIPAGLETADLNGDGKIDSLDYFTLKRFVLGIIKEFPVNQSN
ncbi:UNVERIFIED_CONTAM: dockerin type I repeat protein [Acetivibrio alkalicellulosi]